MQTQTNRQTMLLVMQSHKCEDWETMMDLDIGCRDRKRKGSIGIDIKRFDNDLIADAHKLPFRDKTFRIIQLFEVFEHLHNPLFALQEIHRVLKDDGKMLVTIPNVQYIKRIIRYIKREEISQDQDHIFCWSLSEFRNFLRHGLFKIKSFRFIEHPHWHKPLKISFLLKHITNQHLLMEIIKT